MIVRCHRAFLVNLGQVEQFISHSGSTHLLIKHCHESLPVSRSNMAQVRAGLRTFAAMTQNSIRQ
jgi:DNA-binding LytR/AlgR family response regulator